MRVPRQDGAGATARLRPSSMARRRSATASSTSARSPSAATCARSGSSAATASPSRCTTARACSRRSTAASPPGSSWSRSMRACTRARWATSSATPGRGCLIHGPRVHAGRSTSTPTPSRSSSTRICTGVVRRSARRRAPHSTRRSTSAPEEPVLAVLHLGHHGPAEGRDLDPSHDQRRGHELPRRRAQHPARRDGAARRADVARQRHRGAARRSPAARRRPSSTSRSFEPQAAARRRSSGSKVSHIAFLAPTQIVKLLEEYTPGEFDLEQPEGDLLRRGADLRRAAAAGGRDASARCSPRSTARARRRSRSRG